jgi:hypothetical protein
VLVLLRHACFLAKPRGLELPESWQAPVDHSATIDFWWLVFASRSPDHDTAAHAVSPKRVW